MLTYKSKHFQAPFSVRNIDIRRLAKGVLRQRVGAKRTVKSLTSKATRYPYRPQNVVGAVPKHARTKPLVGQFCVALGQLVMCSWVAVADAVISFNEK